MRQHFAVHLSRGLVELVYDEAMDGRYRDYARRVTGPAGQRKQDGRAMGREKAEQTPTKRAPQSPKTHKFNGKAQVRESK